jgi:hypothetical protein
MTQTLSTIRDGLDTLHGLDAIGARCELGAVTFRVIDLVGGVALCAPAMH